MAFETKLSLRQTQQMIMTPMLQQAISLLQLSRLELVQKLRQEMEINPMLEEVTSGALEEWELTEQDDATGEQIQEEKELDFDWEAYLEGTSDYTAYQAREDKEPLELEARLSKPRSLADHLLFQLHLSTIQGDELKVGEEIIGNIDENGYLQASIEEIVSTAQVEVPVVEKTLRLIQRFEPCGVGARNLKECLLIQLEDLPGDTSLARLLLEYHLEDLEARKFSRIAEKLKVPLTAVQEAFNQISSLDPKPGRTYTTEDPRYITPDVYVMKIDDRFVVVLNDEGLPKLRISPYYRRLLYRRGQGTDASEVREYIESKMRSALWLIRSIEQRQRTLYRVTESICKFQREFLDNGISSLKPLTLREVADDISMHESTVSRVTTNKYVHTPQGLFELKYFFHRGVPATRGGVVSSITVKDLVRKLLLSEDAGRPLSDQKIVNLLKRQGINIARRTVAKYRTQLKIPSSARRKRF